MPTNPQKPRRTAESSWQAFELTSDSRSLPAQVPRAVLGVHEELLQSSARRENSAMSRRRVLPVSVANPPSPDDLGQRIATRWTPAPAALATTLALGLSAMTPSLMAATFTVNQFGVNSDTGDGTCDATCTLRDAIDDAEANGAVLDTIKFATV